MTPAAEALVKKIIRSQDWLFPPPADSPLWRRWKVIYGAQFVRPIHMGRPTRPSDFYVFRSPQPEAATAAVGIGRGCCDRSTVMGRLSTCEIWLQEDLWDLTELLVNVPDRGVTPLDSFLAARHTALFLVPTMIARRRPKRPNRPFMKKKMEPVEVEVTDDGLIRVASFGRDGTTREILLHHSQISLLCEWLREARDSAVGKEESS